VRASDLTIRFGGEEFMVILHDTDADGAMVVAEKVRAASRACACSLPGQSLQKTIAGGAADAEADAVVQRLAAPWVGPGK
jgi:diguanylate cyclase (GGDEF)-like protein